MGHDTYTMKIDGIEVSSMVQAILNLKRMATTPEISDDAFQKQCGKCADLLLNQLLSKLSLSDTEV